MISQNLARYDTKLAQLQRKGRLRALNREAGLDFTSNDYLGLASSSRMRNALLSAIDAGVPVGAGGSRLLRGNHAEHELLEEEAACFFRARRMLYFGSGYTANLAVLSTLPQRGDLVIHDALVHASALEGMKAGRAQVVSVPHNDVHAIDSAIRDWRRAGGNGAPWIVVESLYSMDGDRSSLSDLMEIADRNDGFLYIDEAHATGVHGPDGIGYAAELEGRDNVVVLHTCGKALGAAGALVGASRMICDYLVNRARPFIYSTAPSPLQAASVRQALAILSEEPERRAKLLELVSFANRRFAERFGRSGSGTQILPVIVGSSERAALIAERMQFAGYDIRAIRPPTVAIGTSRLRITVTLNVDAPTIERMIDRLAEVIEEEGV